MGTVTYKYQSFGGSTGGWKVSRYSAKQAKPIDYSLPLVYGHTHDKMLFGCKGYGDGIPYYSFDGQSTYQDYLWGWDAGNFDYCTSSGPIVNFPRPGYEWNQAYARAYSKFLSSIHERAAMMTNLAERAQTVKMLNTRLRQILVGGRQLWAGDFRGFLKTFNIRPLKKHENVRWTRPRQASNLWLEYWFGWAPVVNDIYTATTNYGKPINSSAVKHGSARKWAKSLTTKVSSSQKVFSETKGTVRVNISGRVVVDNPSLFELNRLGLVNPAVVALEVVKFSWLAGWFNNLQQVLAQYTDFVGLSLKDATVSTRTVSTYLYRRDDSNGYFHTWSNAYRWYCRRRVSSLPKVKLMVSLPNGLSVTRGATLASLIVQLFSPKG